MAAAIPNTTPEISVILPFYNAETTLDRAIKSIAGQSYINFECILINNNSTDKSTDIARRWADRDDRFSLIHERKQGVIFASNAGSQAARGKYIARMDADDWSYPDRLGSQAVFLDQHPEYGAVAGLVEHVGHPLKSKGMGRYVEWANSVRTYSEILNARFIESPIINPSAMWRKEVAQQYGIYRSGDFPEDYEMWLRWLHRGVRISKLEEKVLQWHDSETRLTRTDKIYSDRAFYRIKTKYLADWLEKNNPFHPRIVIWGASRISRRRARLLEEYGLEIEYYVDIKRGRQLDREIIYYSELPAPGNCFILTYIKQMNARDEIQEYLRGLGYEEGRNYLLVS